MAITEKEQAFNSCELADLADVTGVCTVILNSIGEVLVGREKIDKESHQRKRDQLSIPLETLKPFERTNRKAMSLAALTEVVTDSCIHEVRKGLNLVGITGPIVLDDKGISGAVAVFHWVGVPNIMPFIPSDEHEFDQLRWMLPEDVVVDSNVRPFAAVALNYAEENGLLNGLTDMPMLALYGFKPSRYMQIREGLHADVK